MKKKDKRINVGFFSAKQFFILLFIVMSINASYNTVYSMHRSNIEDAAIGYMLLGNVLFSTVIVAALLGFARRSMYGRPMRKIAEAARQVAGGDFTIRLLPFRKDGKKDEIEVLVEDFNTMAEELATIETLKTDFIANVSHEIKSPLSVIQSYATAMQDDALSPEERYDYSKTIVEASKRLSDLITNILKLNKLENQEIFPAPEPYSLDEQLRECALSYEELWSKKNITLIGDDINEVTVRYDRSLLELVWNNLISNAIKFTNEGGLITISLKDEDGIAVVTISDTGCGMGEETAAHVFDKFYQGDSSHSTEGNGLGLALAKKVVDIFEGSISVKSKPNEGTCFIVKVVI
ncbi:HAMP domain-containing sensor histidine kinase [Lacrimispora sp.]|jgi:signal transduction histidine kinase|uniref:HAMP domain-containing sensor histidine kinase n=1 Tax=Lacrimispora sp. TaxID=2719234 RepID=UPI00289965E8|nr:HAMP domain-containing sensor histidine kinase [Lacrimispora sp.]